MDLALNNLQGLICDKTHPTNQSTNQLTSFVNLIPKICRLLRKNYSCDLYIYRDIGLMSRVFA